MDRISINHCKRYRTGIVYAIIAKNKVEDAAEEEEVEEELNLDDIEIF